MDLSKVINKQNRKKVVDMLLTPFSWAYGAAVWLRNMAFKLNILKEQSFDVPVVSVGNITAGGTGKTPHVEYIVEALHRQYHIAVLSRGYKRKTKGFVLATDNLSPQDIGDEPYQIFHKFDGLITLAVCESRTKGIQTLLAIDPDINLIVLDDGYQHRYVKPKANILLVDYTRPPYEDKLLPLGNLREPQDNTSRADFVVVTKCPEDVKPVDIRMIKEHLNLIPWQQLFFSRIRYGTPEPVFPIRNPELMSLAWLEQDDLILGITGVANHRPFVKFLKQFGTNLKVVHYPDHHNYKREDFAYIFKLFNELKGKKKYIVTTEKDAVRILNNPYYPPKLRDIIYYIPIRVGFVDYEEKDFIKCLEKKINERPERELGFEQ